MKRKPLPVHRCAKCGTQLRREANGWGKIESVCCMLKRKFCRNCKPRKDRIEI